MQFAHSKMLALLGITLPLLSLFFWWSWRKRQFLVSQFVRSRLLAHLTVGLSRPVQKARMILLVIAVGFLVLTLAQPQWGFAWEEARQRGLDIVLAIDTSRSMLAEDIPPNRLQRAKLAALDLMRLARHDRLALVAFAGTAFLQCPLTLDDEAFRQSINQLDVGIIPQGGTALAEAIETAQTAFKDEGDNHRILVLLTDGEDHDSGAVAAAEKAAATGMRIFTVGIGTPNGELLRQRDEQGHLDYVKDAEGNVVKSRLNETLLTQIATAGHGFYLAMSGSSTIDVLYERGLAPLPKSESTAKLIRQYQERYQWPLVIAIILLLTEMFLPDHKRVRRTDAVLTASNPELRKIVTALALCGLAFQALASSSAALHKYETGQFKDAYQEYSRMLQRHPDDVRLQYNAGAAAYQAKKFEEAAKHFSAAAVAPDLKLQEQAFYNLGNSLFRAGEEEATPDKKMQNWQQATEKFQAALKLDQHDSDAQFNLEFVKKKLEELKQQQQKQQSKDQKKDDQKKDQDKDQQDQQQQQQKDDKQKESKPDKKDSEEQKENQPDQQKKDQDKQQEDKQQSSKSQPEKPQDKKDQGEQSPGSKSDDKKREGETNETDNASAVLPGQMSPEQAKQLLESQKNNEKAMIFLPPDKLKNRKRVFKDW
jgi:Ca-activated chloride channel homolog